MGIESRDYIRENRPSFSFGHTPGDLWAIKYLLIANIVVYVLQSATQNQFTEWLMMKAPYRSVGDALQVWRFVTAGFCHANFQHILFNMFGLWIFGRMVEPIVGSKEFLLFFLTGIVAGNVAQLVTATLSQLPPDSPQIQIYGLGASGGVLAVVLLAAMTFPQRTILFMMIIPMPMSILAVIYVVADVVGVLNPASDGIGHWAHLGGAAFGAAYKYFNWRISGSWDSLRHRFRRQVHRSRTNVKIYRPTEPSSPADLEKQVDEILAKIHEQGESSLTDQERKTLADASRHYRKR